MLSRLRAQFHEVRLGLRHQALRRQERAALVRLGEEAVADGRQWHGGLAGLAAEIAASRRRIDALAAERQASLAQDRMDLDELPGWMGPVVLLRGLCARAVVRHRSVTGRRALQPGYLAAGELALASGACDDGPSGARAKAREVRAIRAELAGAAVERERLLAPFDGRALPGWIDRAGEEGKGYGRAVWRQLRSQLVPKAPALAGMAVGWWIASTYTDSHLRSTLRSIGIGSGGTHVVSGTTYRAMGFWLPLLAAALCAYLGERMAGYYRRRAHESP